MKPLRDAFAAVLTLVATAFLGACNTSNYMGIALTPGAVEPALQQLALRARDGDKQAQLELGIAFEEGRGVPVRLGNAVALYRSASLPTGGTNMIFVPDAAGRTISAVPVDSGPRVEGLPEAKQRLQATTSRKISRASSTGTSSAQGSVSESEIRLPESWDEKHLRQILKISKNINSPSKLSYDGKFLSLFYIEGPLSSERFNSAIYSGDTRSDQGICRVLEYSLSQAWPGSMERCESWQWKALTAAASKPSDRFYTINYSHSGIHPECLHYGECLEPIFSTTSFEYPTCGWFVFYRFQALDGSKMLAFASMDADFYLQAGPKSIVNAQKMAVKKSIYCQKFDKTEGTTK